MTSQFTQSLAQAKPGFDFVAAHFQCEENRYSQFNPNGFVNLGSAQNALHAEMLGERLALSQCYAEDTHYQAFSGTVDCRDAIADYMQSQTDVPVSPSSIVVGNGIISVLEALTIALLNEGESVLIPTPVFPGLVAATSLRVNSKVELMDSRAEDGFRITPEAIEAHLHQLRFEGKNVRAILLCSPGNPVGQVFSKRDLQNFLDVAESFDCELIVDEVYAGSVFDGNEFTSAVSLQSEHVHVLGGLSKDFGLAGYATGWLQTTNQDVVAAVAKQAHFFRLPAPIQRILSSILDPSWRIEYLQLHQKKLTQTEVFARTELDAAGIKSIKAQAGLCLWVDLRDYLTAETVDAELELYQRLLNQHRVHISPGSGFKTSSPGYFRLCFSQPHEVLQEGLKRLISGLRSRVPATEMSFHGIGQNCS